MHGPAILALPKARRRLRLARGSQDDTLGIDDIAGTFVMIFDVLNLLVQRIQRDIDADRADGLTAIPDGRGRRDDRLLRIAVLIDLGEHRLAFADGFLVPRTAGRRLRAITGVVAVVVARPCM